MKIKLIRWGTFPPKTPFLVKVPYALFGEFAAQLDEMAHRPKGLVPPSKPDDLEFTARTAATARSFFPDFDIYVPVSPISPREFVRASRGAGFTHFALPSVQPWGHYWQEVHDLLGDKTLHIAGGAPPPDWMHPNWTWSEETL